MPQGEKIVLNLSEHFTKKWEECEGSKPTLAGINDLLSQATRIQSQRLMYRKRNGEMEPYILLAQYCLWERRLILVIDEERRRAVTVVAEERLVAAGKHERRCGNAGYIPLTAHDKRTQERR